MTTIVADLECMAADNRITGGGPLCHVLKIQRIRGSLFGFAGDAALAMILLHWLKGKRDLEALYKLIPPDHRNDVELLELSRKGLAYWNGWGVPLPLMDESYAIGSGAPAALSGMREGNSPAGAIRRAGILDECSGILKTPQVEMLKVKRAKSA